MSIKDTRLSKGVTSFLFDFMLLVIGIYLALWMENKVQDWENNDKQRDYLNRLSLDLQADIDYLKNIKKRQETKITTIEKGIQLIVSGADKTDPAFEEMAVNMAQSVNNYYFFEPQKFTFLSMRESGDFKLIKDNEIKTKLLELHRQYEFLDTLQKNYLQGLDTEFIPLWIRHVNMITNEVLDDSVFTNPIFDNMIGFAYNETSQRKTLIDDVITQAETLQKMMQVASKKSESFI
ncbi:hypothetical protein EYS14_22255 [Alteromonadaceae bacterium M269]|nr:hypothetical protein EYS14_22255 [Alteromonadaceae bacterium M269]